MNNAALSVSFRRKAYVKRSYCFLASVQLIYISITECLCSLSTKKSVNMDLGVSIYFHYEIYIKASLGL
jgi:hypothetical protein